MIEIIHLDDKHRWDEVATQFKKFSVFYLSDYVEAFCLEKNNNAFLFNLVTDDCKGYCVRFVNEINTEIVSKSDLYDLSSQYGYGGFVIEGNQITFFREYNNYCLEKNYIAEFVRFSLFDNYTTTYPGKVIIANSNVYVDLDIDTVDIYNKYKRGLKKNIKSAIKNEVTIIIDRTNDFFIEFYDIYINTMKRNNAEKGYFFSKEFFYKLMKMNNNIFFAHAFHNDILISTELVLYDLNYGYSFLGGTLSEYFHLHPNHLLKHEIIKYLKSLDIKKYILGGGTFKEDGIYKFKLSFNPTGYIDFIVGNWIFDIPRYKKLCLESDREFEDKQKNSEYFPYYRKR